MNSCLVVGAGMAGLTAARVLQQSGWDVVLLDKGRGLGGRMATRRIGESRFDHGAQFFTVRDPRFQSAVDRWQTNGWVAPWFTDSGHTRYQAVDGMRSLATSLSQGLDVRFPTTAVQIEPQNQGWRTVTQEGGEFLTSAILLTPPAPQSLTLLADCIDRLPSEIPSALNGILYASCFALLVCLDGPSAVPSPGFCRPEGCPIAFIADNTQKGVSTGPAALTIHATSAFTSEYMDAPQEEVARLLLQAAEPWLGSAPTAWQLHRWKYAQATISHPDTCLFTAQPAPLAFAGDGFGAPRIEGAFLSGLAAAERILGV